MDIAFVLLAKTLRSSTFKLALVAIGVFGAIVLGLFSYIYLSTKNYVNTRADQAVARELATLQNVFRREGLDGVVSKIGQDISDRRLEGIVLLLADPSFAVVAGNIKEWPVGKRTDGWGEFRESGPTSPLMRAMVQTLPDGIHLLVGRSLADLAAFMQQIATASLKHRLDTCSCRDGECHGHTTYSGTHRVD